MRPVGFCFYVTVGTILTNKQLDAGKEELFLISHTDSNGQLTISTTAPLTLLPSTASRSLASKPYICPAPVPEPCRRFSAACRIRSRRSWSHCNINKTSRQSGTSGKNPSILLTTRPTASVSPALVLAPVPPPSFTPATPEKVFVGCDVDAWRPPPVLYTLPLPLPLEPPLWLPPGCPPPAPCGCCVGSWFMFSGKKHEKKLP
jgi:hypothetical protein